MNPLESFNSINPSAVAVGKFDGLHLGHQLLIQRIASERKNGLDPILIAIADPKRPDGILLPDETRKKLKESGICRYLRVPLTAELRSMEPDRFIEEILVSKLHAKLIAAGDDFCFGKDRKGSVKTLEERSEELGFETAVFPKLRINGRVVSSALIRELITEGRISEANDLLGYSFFIRGAVGHGQALGRTLGFPTINLNVPSRKICPKYGVYTVLVMMGRKTFPGVANFGVRPTVSDGTKAGLEVHLLQNEGNYYGKTVSVSFLDYLRPEIRFNSLTELKRQVEEDRRTALAYFGSVQPKSCS